MEVVAKDMALGRKQRQRWNLRRQDMGASHKCRTGRVVRHTTKPCAEPGALKIEPQKEALYAVAAAVIFPARMPGTNFEGDVAA